MSTLEGVVMPGHGIASGSAANSPYPQGSVAMQMPFFKALGLDLSAHHVGTVNVSIAPLQWTLVKADYCFENLAWTHLHPPETFSFVRCVLVHQGCEYGSWIYKPHPETKAAHFQSTDVVEVIAPRITALAYGDNVQIRVDATRITAAASL
jgi:hypothetical protein